MEHKEELPNDSLVHSLFFSLTPVCLAGELERVPDLVGPQLEPDLLPAVGEDAWLLRGNCKKKRVFTSGFVRPKME